MACCKLRRAHGTAHGPSCVITGPVTARLTTSRRGCCRAVVRMWLLSLTRHTCVRRTAACRDADGHVAQGRPRGVHAPRDRHVA